MKRVGILGIVGSPRRGGNTETLVDEVLHGAREAGVKTEKVILSELHVEPCRACNSCKRTGNCIIDDDMASIVEKMEASYVWVLGTPIYWWGPTAQMKALIDRWYGLPRGVFNGKRIILVIPSGGSRIYSDLTVRMLEEIIPYLNMKELGVIRAPGSNSRDHAKMDEGLKESARNIGLKSVKDII